ncbi:MAG TPA: two-component regulator propeller domain-containing protein [Saprospiraceae bacterium]|nr:two-component regulator propeller domain-containing protein [Saprospiraceae bacterium]
MIYRYILTWVGILSVLPIAAQSPPPHTLWFHSLTAKEGLTQSYNWYVYHDSEGFVWISSLTGLSRFDGVHVKLYNSVRGDTTSLDGENIYSEFFEDARQNIWFSTPAAIHCYERQDDHFRRYYPKGDDGQKIPGELKVHFLEKDSFLWFSTGTLMYRMNIHAPDHAAQSVMETQQIKFRMELDPDGYVQRVFAFGMVKRLDVYTVYKGALSEAVRHAFPGEFVREVLPESNDRAWVLTDQSGLVDWNPVAQNNRFVFREFDSRPGALTPWGRDHLILVVKGEGVFIIDKSSHHVYPVDCKFIDSDAKVVQGFKNAYLDKEGNLWISDENRGVHYANLRKTKFRSLPKYPSDGNDNYTYWALVEDKSGNILAGTSPGGVFYLDKNGQLIRHFTHLPGDPYSLPSNWVRDVFRDRDDNIWVATPGGLARFDPEQKKFYSVPRADGIKEGQYIYIHQTNTGRILVASENEGIFEIKTTKGRKQLVNIMPATTGIYQSIFEDTDGRLYCVRNSSEICVFDLVGDSDRPILKDSISVGGLVNGFYENKCDGMLYFATANGLVKVAKNLHSAEPVVYTEANGLPGKFIGAMMADPDNNLWLGTNNGLAFFGADSIRSFLRSDGTQSLEFDLMAAMRRSNGDLWFGGADGITIVPAGAPLAGVGNPPKVLLTGIKINDVEPDSLRCQQTGATNITRIRQLVLPYHQNTISLDFVAVEYSDPSNNRLWYMLEGKDDHWVGIEKGKPGFARYAKLPHGEYTFWLRATNSDGQPGPSLEILKITIDPPWYLTWWFKLLAGAAFTGLLYGIYRDRVARIRKKEEMLRKEAEFKQKEAEFRQREAEDKQQMAETETAILRLQMNPHFIFNSMNSINAYILKRDIDTASDYLGRFAGLMRMILNLAAKPYIPITDEIHLLEQYLRTEAMRFEKSFTYTFEVDPSIDQDDTIVPTMILQPFVENAIWHGLLNKKGEGHIKIGFSKQDETLLCSVEDDGIGREEARRIKNGSAVHGSKALSITQRRLELLREETGVDAGYEIVDLANAEGQALGTKVLLHLPIL